MARSVYRRLHTDRQRTAVLAAAAAGMSDRRTAETLGISLWTVKEYRKAAIAFLDARNMTHAVALAIRGGIID